jgi:hypothetical protein
MRIMAHYPAALYGFAHIKLTVKLWALNLSAYS